MSKSEHTPSGSRGSEDETRTPDLTKRTSAEPTEKDAGQPGAARGREAEPERDAGRKPAGSAPEPAPAEPGGTGADATAADEESGAEMSVPAEAEPEPEAAEAAGTKADLAKPAGAKPESGKSAEPGKPAKSAGSAEDEPDSGKAAGSGRGAADAAAAVEPGAADGSAEAEPRAAEPAGAKADLGKPAAAKHVAGAAGAAKADLSKSATAKPDAGDAAAAGETKAGSGGSGAPKPGAGAGAGAKGRAGTSDAKSDAVKADAAKADRVKADKAEPGKGEAARAGQGTAGKSAPEGAGPKGVTGDTAEDEGRLLARRYRLERVLGKGGMGTVWRAVDETLGRTVAVKELRFSSGVDEDEKRRLITRTLREAKAIARIRSGGAVTVFDVVDEDGRPWIVMELIEGSSLAEFIREKGTLTPRRAAEVGLAVLDVLKAAHGEGILHRDVKPSNVLISNSGRVVLTDFGIAQVEGDPSVTSTGMLVGAPSYISPERARGQKPGPPADMWSLGGLLYAAVEGVPPYDKGSALATLTAVMTEPVDPPNNAGPLADVIYGLLVKDPARRLDDARARVMLTEVINAPEEPAAPPADETRVISLTAAKEAAEKAAAEKAATKAAEKAAAKAAAKRDREQRERAREALKTARKAAAAAVSTTAANGAEAPAQTGTGSGAKSPAGSSASAPAAPSSGRPGAASLTDVVPRRTIALAIAAVVVALAVIGSLVAWAIGGDDEKGGKGANKGGPGSNASGSPAPGGSTGSDGKGNGNGGTNGQASGGTQGTGGSTPAPGQSTGSSGSGSGTGGSSGTPGTIPGPGTTPGVPAGPGTLPAGYTTVTNAKYHFSIAMPDFFKEIGTAGSNSGMKYARDDSSFPRIQVDYNNSPGDDARKAWAELAIAVGASSKGYELKGIDTVEYRGYPTVADWVFEREQNGVRVRVLNRGFKVDATHGYAIMITCAADQWDGPECTQLRNTAFDTFQVKD
ncbi:protein kinase [Streptomyces sp. NPDC048603]|uniref:serine/threonine-protein kinase n=1 Tax=Streptomyces sp. NPDC048603 TaxID=3365577 RepID=UPI003718CB9F